MKKHVLQRLEELEAQIYKIYGDDEASAERRINKAKMEMDIAPLFRNIVYNDDPEKAAAEIKAKILEEIKARD